MVGTARDAPLSTLRRRGHRFEPRQETLLGLGGAPGREIVPSRRLGQAGIAPEQALGLGFREAGELGRLEKGGSTVGRLDLPRDLLGQYRRQSEPDMDRGQQAFLDHLVVASEYRLE